MKKLITLITVIFALSVLTPAVAFSEEGKVKKFWLQTKESVKEAGKDIKEGTKKAGKEIKEGSKKEYNKGEKKVKKDVNDAKNAFSD